MSLSTTLITCIFILVAFCSAPAEACMNISNKEAAAILTFLVVFCPFIGIYYAGVGSVHAVKSGVDKIREAKQKRHFRKVQHSFLIQRDEAVDSIGGEEKFQEYLQTLFEKSTKTPSFESSLELAVALMSAKDLLAAEEVIRNTLTSSPDIDQTPALRKGAGQYILGVILQQLGSNAEAADVFHTAAVTLESAGADAQVEIRNGLPAITLSQAYYSQGTAMLQGALYDGHDDDIDYPKVRQALVWFDKAVETSNSADYQLNRGVALFTLASNPCGINKDALRGGGKFTDSLPCVESLTELQQAIEAFQIVSADESSEGAPMAIHYLARCHALLGNPAKAVELYGKSIDLDENIPRIEILAVEDLCNPWPRPQPIYPGHGSADHDWNTRRFKSPTWCDSCMKRITLKELIDSPCDECTRCKMRVHHGCKAALEGKMCWPSYRAPLVVGSVVSTPSSKSSVKTGVVTGIINTAQVMVKWEGESDSRPTYKFNVTVIKSSMEPGAPGLAHIHKLKPRKLHRPHWCDACKKFIASKEAYQCCECPILIHKECIPSNAVIAE